MSKTAKRTVIPVYMHIWSRNLEKVLKIEKNHKTEVVDFLFSTIFVISSLTVDLSMSRCRSRYPDN